MPDGYDSLSERDERKAEEQGPTLSKLVNLAPLFELVVRILELLLKILRIIN